MWYWGLHVWLTVFLQFRPFTKMLRPHCKGIWIQRELVFYATQYNISLQCPFGLAKVSFNGIIHNFHMANLGDGSHIYSAPVCFVDSLFHGRLKNILLCIIRRTPYMSSMCQQQMFHSLPVIWTEVISYISDFCPIFAIKYVESCFAVLEFLQYSIIKRFRGPIKVARLMFMSMHWSGLGHSTDCPGY